MVRNLTSDMSPGVLAGGFAAMLSTDPSGGDGAGFPTGVTGVPLSGI
jgi:hypothetical protein